MNDELEADLLKVSEEKGYSFKAYDKSYDLGLEIKILNDLNSGRIYRFPIIAYAYTEEGYQQIYQGFNVTPLFKFEKVFELHLKIKTF